MLNLLFIRNSTGYIYIYTAVGIHSRIYDRLASYRYYFVHEFLIVAKSYSVNLFLVNFLCLFGVRFCKICRKSVGKCEIPGEKWTRKFIRLRYFLPSSRVVATTSGVMGPWPSTLYACTTTLYRANFFKFVSWYCLPGIDVLASPKATLAVEIRLSTVRNVYWSAPNLYISKR